MASVDPLLRRFFVLHGRMQQLFRAWGRSDHAAYSDSWASLMDVDCLRQLQGSLGGPAMDDDALRERLGQNYASLESMANAWQQLAGEQDPSLRRFIEPPRAPATDVRNEIDLERLRIAPSVLT
jgi:hypothetical protein